MPKKDKDIQEALNRTPSSAANILSSLLGPSKAVEKPEEPRRQPRNLAKETRLIVSEEPRNLGKQEPRNRGRQLNVEINPLALKALKQYALDNEITLIQAVEEAISLLGGEEPRNQGTHDDDDDYKGTDESSSVAAEYQRLTKNKWSGRDASAYRKISHISADQIISSMREIYDRAKTHPANFSYFVTSILNERVAPNLKSTYRRYLKEIYATHVGGNLSTSDIIFHLKRRCARDNTQWNDDAANEAIAS